MKKKIIFAIAISFFAVVTVFNMNMLQANNADDISLESLTIMAQAQTESGGCDSSCSLTQTVKIKDAQGRVVSVETVTVCQACCSAGQRASCGNGFMGIGGGCKCD